MSHAPRLFPHHLINRGVLLGVVLFLAFAGSWAETRLIGVCGLIICAEAIRNVATLFERSRWRDGVLVLAVVGVSANAFFLTAAEVRERGREDKGGRGFSVLRDWVGESPGGAPFRHPPERVGRLAVSLEPRMYFLAPFQAVRLGDSPRLDRELSAHQTPHAHATVLCREGFSSLLLSNYSFDFFYNTKVALSLQELPKLYPEAIIEAAPVETLMDLKKICSQH